MIQVLIIEDLPILLAGLRMCLSSEPGLSVIGGALDFESGLDLTKRCSPDVVVLDIDSPFIGSIATASQLREICQQARVVLLAMDGGDAVAMRAREAGAAALVTKCMPVDALVTTIRKIVN